MTGTPHFTEAVLRNRINSPIGLKWHVHLILVPMTSYPFRRSLWHTQHSRQFVVLCHFIFYTVREADRTLWFSLVVDKAIVELEVTGYHMFLMDVSKRWCVGIDIRMYVCWLQFLLIWLAGDCSCYRGYWHCMCLARADHPTCVITNVMPCRFMSSVKIIICKVNEKWRNTESDFFFTKLMEANDKL